VLACNVRYDSSSDLGETIVNLVAAQRDECQCGMGEQPDTLINKILDFLIAPFRILGRFMSNFYLRINLDKRWHLVVSVR
jgi:hypothetical protein